MGKGDKKTKRGKIFKGSFGNTRKRKTSTPVVVKPVEAPAPEVETKKKPPKKK